MLSADHTLKTRNQNLMKIVSSFTCILYFAILPISNERLEQLKEETRKDPILQTLIKYTIEGWPEKTLISYELHPYFTHRSDISYHEGLLLKDQRIIVPSALRSEMKPILHQ